MRTCGIKWNYSSNWTGVFLCKSSSRTKHNWYCIIGFLINAVILNYIFILHYHYFFVKNFFSSEVHMSVNTTFEMFFCWERSHRLSTYATGGGWGIIQNAYSCVQGEGRVRLHVYVRTCTTSFHVLGSSFVLYYFVLFFIFLQKFNLY